MGRKGETPNGGEGLHVVIGDQGTVSGGGVVIGGTSSREG